MRCSPYVPACARALVLEAKLCCPPALSTQNYPHACANGIRRSATDVVPARWRVQATGTSQHRIWPQLRCYSGCAPSLCVLSHLTDTLRVSIACCLVGGAHFLFGLVDGTPLQNTPWQFVVPIGIIVLYGTGYSLLVSSLRAVGWHQPAQARIFVFAPSRVSIGRIGPMCQLRATALVMFPCVPLVISNPKQLGTAFGIIFSLQNTGLVPPHYAALR